MLEQPMCDIQDELGNTASSLAAQSLLFRARTHGFILLSLESSTSLAFAPGCAKPYTGSTISLFFVTLSKLPQFSMASPAAQEHTFEAVPWEQGQICCIHLKWLPQEPGSTGTWWLKSQEHSLPQLPGVPSPGLLGRQPCPPGTRLFGRAATTHSWGHQLARADTTSPGLWPPSLSTPAI